MKWFRNWSPRRQRAGRAASRRTAPQLTQLEPRQMLTVTYHGGALLTNVEVEALYYGSEWYDDPTDYSQTGQLDAFLKSIVNSPYMDALSNAGYGVGRGSFTRGTIYEANLNPYYFLDDSTIRSTIQAEIDNGWLQPPDSNRLYVVFVEPGVAVSDGTASSLSNFLGYHGAFAGYDASGNPASIRYAVIPYPGAATSYHYADNLPTMDSITAVTSHELAEGVTDPDVNYRQLGWYDDTLNGEIGDITEGQSAAYATLNGYVVQLVADQNDNILQLTQGGPGGSSVILVVLDDGDLYQCDASGAHYLVSGVRSASLTYTPSGSLVYEVVFENGAWYQCDATGAHYVTSGVESASLTYTPSGSPVFEVVFDNGAWYQFDGSGAHYVTGGVESASLSYTASGSPVFEVAFDGGSLYQYDAAGAHYLAGGVWYASVA